MAIEEKEKEYLYFLLRNEADISARHRIRAILDFLDIQPGERVLDCGCGLGFHLEVVSHLVDCRLTGLDFDLSRLSRAQRSLRKPVPLGAGDIYSLPYPADSFEKIILSEVLEHLSEDEVALREVKRVLKPGGVLAITVPHHHYPFFWDPVNWTREHMGLDPIRSGFFGGLWTNHERLYTRSGLVDLVESTGFSVEEVRQSVHYCFPFSHNLVYGLGKWLVESGRLPSADRFGYREQQQSLLNPVHLGLGLFRLIDRLNDPVSDDGKVTVSLSLKARKH